VLLHSLKLLLRSKSASADTILAEKIRSILIVRQHNQLGDMLCSVPLFEALRKRFTNAHITLVASPINYEILFSDINPYIDEVLVYDKSSSKTLRAFYKKLRSKSYDIGIVPSTVSVSRTSHLINYFSRAPIRVGVKSIDGIPNKVEYLLNVKSDFKWDELKLHQVERNLDIGRQVGCDLPENERGIKIILHEDEYIFGINFINEHFPDRSRPIISFHPGAGKAPNRWSEGKFIELMKKLNKEHNAYILITSGVIDTEITSRISAALKTEGIESVVLSGTPVRMVGSVIKNTDLYITNDTGTMHVAAGVDANVLALFGPTNGYEWAPYGKNKMHIQSQTGNINDISVGEVYNKAGEFIKSHNIKKTSVTR
jgi:heptosyltransferase-2